MAAPAISTSDLESVNPANLAEVVDIHGKRQLPLNVLWSWGGQFVLIASGFILPRLIDRSIGQSALGVWDFGWSLISHFALIQGGIASSINRYIAKYRAQDRSDAINEAVSSVAMVLRVMGFVIVCLTLASVWAMPSLLRGSLSGYLTQARWLVLLLGLSLAVQVSASVYGGILTGFHRWDWHNGIYAVTYALMLGGMVVVLELGYGLIGLAAVSLCGETLGRLIRVILSYRICPGLEIRLRHLRWATARSMMGFGGKTFVFDCSYLLLAQTISVFILASLGPASLALFSRPMALVRTVKNFMTKYAYVFVPTASSLEGAGQEEELRRLAVKATRFGLLICLPALLLLVLLGGDILDLWMGGRYANAPLIEVLACVHFFSIAYAPLFFVLCGLNRHGRTSLVLFVAAAFGASLAFIWLEVMHGGLVAAALFSGLPWMLVNGIYLPIHACARLSLKLGQFLDEAWRRPLLANLPYLVCLLAIRLLHLSSVFKTLALGVFLGGVVLAVSYWIFAITEGERHELVRRLSFRRTSYRVGVLLKKPRAS